jgi:hypothetical protein
VSSLGFDIVDTESTRSSSGGCSICEGDRPDTDGRGVASELDRKLTLLFTSVDDAESGDGDGELPAVGGRTDVSRYIVGGIVGRVGATVSRGKGGSGASSGIGK